MLDEIGERIPHTRGDEPRSAQRAAMSVCVFPTRVGMNLTIAWMLILVIGYSPHAWG